MTKVVAQVVYQLDVDELPLKKLEKQHKSQVARGRSRSSVGDVTSNRRKTFSQGLLMKVNAGKSHPVLNRSGSIKRDRTSTVGGAVHPQVSHHPLNPAAKVTGDSQLGEISREPLLVDSTISLSSESPMDRQASISSQHQQSPDGSMRRGSEPTSTADHPLLTQTFSAPIASSNTPSPVPTHSPLVAAENKPPWAANESPISTHGHQSTSAFVPTLQANDFILTNENAEALSIHDNSPSSSRRVSENTSQEPNKKYMTKAFSVDDTRQKLLASDSSTNRLLSSPDSFSSDILPDRSGSIKIRKTHGSGRRGQPNVIQEEKADTSKGPGEGDCCIRISNENLYPIESMLELLLHCILQGDLLELLLHCIL